MRVAVVGAGASGLMCAGFIKKLGHDVFVFDGNEKAGKKLYITGKGRCNFTNLCDQEDFSQNIVRGEKFLKSALSNFNSFDTLSFFENLGLEAKTERGNRVFPQSDKSSDVIKALLDHCEGVEFHFNEKVEAINKKDRFVVVTSKNKYEFDRVIVATGGVSYSATGSTGDGYKFAKVFGHNIVDIKPALVPIILQDDFVKSLQGLSLKNVKLKVEFEGKKIEEFGEMMFTDNGITGPIVLKISSLINRHKVDKIAIDFKPALDEKKLELRLLREFENAKNKNISNVMKTLLPSSLIDVFLKRCSISLDKKINSITVAERRVIIENLKNFELKFKSLADINLGIITSGGVDLNEINPKTMESKLIPGLYFIGEVLDIDAFTGGFNLQIAFSTAVKCSQNF